MFLSRRHSFLWFALLSFAACTETTVNVIGASDEAGVASDAAVAADGTADGEQGIADASVEDVAADHESEDGSLDASDAAPIVDAKVTDTANCGPAPILHPTPGVGVLCPAQTGGASACPATAGEHCCVYTASSTKPSTCNGGGTACDVEVDAGGADFACDEPSDCPGGQKCCFLGSVKKDPVCYNFGSLVKGSHCAAACPVGELTICAAQAECVGVVSPGGTNCVPFNTKAKELGVCLP